MKFNHICHPSNQQKKTATHLNEFLENALTSLAHVVASYLFTVRQHAITTEKLDIRPSAQEVNDTQN